MKTERLLSIIVPVYNVEEYLGECIDSILQQTFRDYELILVDDGSTDCSGEICDRYASEDDRIVMVHKENGGVSSARNAGLKLAKGEFFTFVDADDFIAQDTYKSNMDIIAQDNSLDIIQFPCIDYHKEEMPQHLFKGKIVGCEDILARWWAGDTLTFSTCNKIYKRAIFDGITFLEHHVSEDTRLIVDFYKRAKSVYVSDVGCYFYRQNEKSQTAHYTFDKHLDLFEAHLLIYKEITKYKSLRPQLPIAYDRLSRRLLQAHLSDDTRGLSEEYATMGRLAPTWMDILFARNANKPYLCCLKLFGPKMFLPLFSIYLKHKST